MVAVRWKLMSVMALSLVLGSTALGQSPNPTDEIARREIQKLRKDLGSVAKKIDDQISKQSSAQKGGDSSAQSLDKIAAQLNTISKNVDRATSDSVTPWALMIISAALYGGVTYGVLRAVLGQRQAPPAADHGLNGSLNGQLVRQQALRELRHERISVLSQIRAKVDELEADARTYAGVYALMLAYQTARNAPLQRLAEISTREQEALLRYRTIAGQFVSLGYEYGRMPEGQIDSGLPEDLGAWLAHWIMELESTLELDMPGQPVPERRNDLFKQIRQKLLGLLSSERESGMARESSYA